jgi:hypothetical protein
VSQLVTRLAAISMIVAWMGVVVPDVAFAASGDELVRCESSSRETVRCGADTRGGVVLQRQLSRAGCWYDETWGFDARGIWVSNGCRADFALGRTTATSQAYGETPASDEGITGSDVALGAGAVLVLGAIAAAVLANQNNDDNDSNDDRYTDRNRRRDGNRDRSYGGSNDPWGRDQVVRCESDGKKERYCKVNTRRGVELYRQHSKARCRYGSSWGYDRKGIWVDEGCRADFLIRG